MTRTSIREYAEALRGRYLKASRPEKKLILDAFCQATGYHRKSAIRLLRHPPRSDQGRGGRRKEYRSDFVAALRVAWEATDRICSKRLAPFLPELLAVLEHHGELVLGEEVRAQLLRVSASTIDRVLKPFRERGGRRSLSTTCSSSVLKRLIPIRAHSDWRKSRVGEMEVDLVAHCGRSAEGFYLHTLVAVDLATGWTECVPVWGKSQSRVGSGVDRVRRQVPFKLLALDSDNGGEFINHGLWEYCQRHSIVFTRSRSYKKNDQAHVEQRNWSAVRRLVGYDRYASKAAYQQLEKLYNLVRLHLNFFQPIRRLIATERVGSKVRKRYDSAQTAYRRLLAAGVLEEAEQQALATLYQALNPAQLRAEIDETLRSLWQMAQPDPRSQQEAIALAKLDAASAQPKPSAKRYPISVVTLPSEASLPLR